MYKQLLLALVSLVFITGAATAETPVADEVAEALLKCWGGEFDQSLTITTDLIKREELTTEERVSIYAALSAIYYSKGEQYFTKSFDYLEKIDELGSCLDNLPPNFWAQPIRNQWWEILGTTDVQNCSNKSTSSIQTIAIIEFDNHSIGKYQEELGFIMKGISDSFESDFRDLNGLQVIERDRADHIINEIKLSQSGLVDEATAIQAGKLLGAQIMVFGSLMQLGKNEAHMLVKAVKVETSEIIATAERSGKPEYFKMKRELVKELAQKLDIIINPETELLLKANGSDSHNAGVLYAKGIYHVDRLEYSTAYDFFKKAYEMDSSFEEAKNKMNIYRPLAMSS